MVRIKNIEKISKDMVTLVGKSAMVNMGYGGDAPTPSYNDVKTSKNDRTNPLVGQVNKMTIIEWLKSLYKQIQKSDNKELEDILGVIEKDIKQKKNLSGSISNIKDLKKYLSSV